MKKIGCLWQNMERLFDKKCIRVIKNILVICIVILAAFYGAASKSESWPVFKERLFGGEEVPKLTYSVDQLELTDYACNGNQLSALNDDPKIMFSGLNGYLDNLSITFADAVSQDVMVQVYYSEDGSGFAEEKSIVQHLDKGEKQAILNVERRIDGLRVDIGNAAGQTFAIADISLNKQEYTSGSLTGIISSGMFWLRFEILFLLYLFIGLHFILDLDKMYQFIYKWRWVIGFGIVLFLTVNKLHGDSIFMYDAYVQTGEGSEFVEPVLGEARAIRSDEWLVETSKKLSSRYLDEPFGKYTNILRGTKTLNPTHLGIENIAYNCMNFSYLVLGLEYGFYFVFNLTIVLSFLVTFEFFMILTKKKKLLSLLGAVMMIGSAFYLWWGFPALFLFAHGSLTCFYHFFKADCKERVKKALLALGTSVSVMGFVTILYPAWEVPMGFVVLAFLVGMIHELWDDIKKQDVYGWVLFAIAFIFFVGMVAFYLFRNQEYMTAIMGTVYPGKRISDGGYAWNKVWYYFQSFLYPFKDVGNPSEYSTLCSLFPLPIVVAVIHVVRTKKKDWTICGLLLVAIYLALYTSTGLPTILAKVTMMQNSIPERTVDIVGIVSVYLMILLLAKEREYKFKLYPLVAVLLSGITVGISIYVCNKYFPGYIGMKYTCLVAVILGLFGAVVVCNKYKKVNMISYILVIVLFAGSSLYIRPLQRGFDAIDSKPLAKKIREISSANPDDKWIASNIVLSGFSVACGAPTINSVNFYPNLDLWKKLDTQKQYNEVYNRYAHVDVQFNDEETKFVLETQDTMLLSLAYKDIYKTGARYMVSTYPIDISNEYVTFKELYTECGSYIYEIQYNS